LANPPAGSNGLSARNPSHPHGSSRLPKAHGWTKQGKVLAAGSVLLLFGLAVVGALYFTGFLFPKEPFSGPTWVVRKEILKVTVVARGSLESARNGDIVCNVRAALAGSKGGQNSTTIKWLIDNGTEVKKGDLVMILDDSGLQESLKTQKIAVDNAKSEWVTADKTYQIDDIQCTTDIEKAINARDLAKLDLDKYIKGDFVQAKKDVEGRIETGKSDYEDWKDRAAWSARMVKKNLMSKVQADADANRVDASRIALEKLNEERRVLVDYMYQRTVTDLTAKVNEAEHNLDKAKITKDATLGKDDAARQSKKSVYEQQDAMKTAYEVEILKCEVKAPQDGLVVYYVPEQVRGGGGTQQSIVAQGEPVREGQKMMQIPDLNQMLVNTKVPEAFVAYLHNERDPADKSTWQMCQIRVDAFSNRVLNGHVRTIDTVASQQDFFSSDVKNYKTMVSVDQSLDGLKPGMSAEVTIYADESPTPVLVVPVQAVVGSIASGATRKCFVVGADGQPEMRDIVVGMCNERLVEIKSGLKEGEVVVQNPTPLLKDSDMKAGKVRSKNEDDSHGGGSDPAKKDKKGGSAKKGDGPPGGGGAGGFQMTPEQKQAAQAALIERMRPLSPEGRRDALNAIPDAYRDQARQALRNANLEVAD
jgi:HlyD family secretion protein